MTDFSFTFGPNGSYFLKTPLQWLSRGLPQSLRDTLYTDIQAKHHFVAIGPEGEYFYGRNTPKRGDTWTFLSGDTSTALTAWLNERTSAGDGKIQVSYSADKTWVACTTRGAAYWSGHLPAHVTTQIRNFHPIKITLGVDAAYVMVASDGRFKWNLAGRYDTLDQILRNSTLAIESVTLNPYASGQFLIIFKDGSWRAVLPVAYMDTVSTAIKESVRHMVQINSQITSMVCQNMLENQRTTNNFLLGLLR